MATSIFKLVGSIFVENDEANKNIENTSKKADSLGNKFSEGVGKAAKWGASLVKSAADVASSMYETAYASAKSLDDIQKGAQKLGISYEAYQKLGYACDRSGTSIEAMSKGIKNLTKTMAGQGTSQMTEAMESLGIAITDANGQIRKQEDVLADTLYALADMEDITQRDVIASQIFGNSYMDLIPLLNSGADGIRELTTQCEDLGLVMSDTAIDEGAKFADTMDDLNAKVENIKTQIITAALPALGSFATWLTEHMPDILVHFNALQETAQWAWDTLSKNLKDAWDFAQPYIEDFCEAVVDIENSFSETWNTKLKPFFEDTLKFIKTWVVPGWELAFDKMKIAGEYVFDKIGKLIDDCKTGLSGMTTFLSGIFTLDWQKAWHGIGEYAEGVLNGIMDWFSPVKDAFDWLEGKLFGHVNDTSANGGSSGSSGGASFEIADVPTYTQAKYSGATTTTQTSQRDEAYQQRLAEAISQLAGAGLYLDGSTLVGQIAPKMDLTLGGFATNSGRGVR